MGQGKNIKCGCGEWELMWGVGMFYPDAYQETLTEIKNGKYGEEMKKLANETELVTIDASLRTYWCGKCGRIKSSPCLDLYKPNNIKSAKKTIIGNWAITEPKSIHTVSETNDWPYWDANSRNKEEGDYVLLRKYKHICPVCEEVMHEVEEEDTEEMRCPKCGKKYKDTSFFCWD